MMNNVFIVWCYDDGILKVFSSRDSANDYVEEVHDKGYYHREDLNIVEEEVYE